MQWSVTKSRNRAEQVSESATFEEQIKRSVILSRPLIPRRLWLPVTLEKRRIGLKLRFRLCCARFRHAAQPMPPNHADARNCFCRRTRHQHR
jgi:hypothetical protein